jgi:type IV pilus assembly protein PilB
MVGKIRDKFNKLPARQMLDMVVNDAISAKASFIHIEPGEQDVMVRYRINGSLVEISRFPKKRFDSLIERLKSLANLDTRIRNIPQDGKFKIYQTDSSYLLQVSFIPTIKGEKISIKLLDNQVDIPNLTDLGYWGAGLVAIRSALNQPSGLILLCGPKQSGKSLSLFSLLSSVDSSDIKIATIEDQTEYILADAVQMQVNPKTNLTLGSGFIALQKHDNDIIMVSELRESEIAKLVFSHATRNKLVISSIYAGSIEETIHKLNHMGISPAEITHGLRLISSQRLIKRLCQSCRESYTPDKNTLDSIDKLLNLNGSNIKAIHKLELAYLQETNNNPKISPKDLSTTETKIRRLWRHSKTGCQDCLFRGFSGYIGLYEVVRLSPTIKSLVISLASPQAIMSQAIKEGTLSLQIDSLVKALAGYTVISEVFSLLGHAST